MSPRNRHALLAAGLTAASAALYVSLPGKAASPVVVASTPPPQPVQAADASPPPAPLPDLGTLRLHGLTATGAIIASTRGQRLVALGREVIPGVTLHEVRQHHAVLATAAGRFELGFLGAPQTAPTAPTAASASRSPAPAFARRTEVLQYRLGLAPLRADGRISGFALRPGAEMPLLHRAGLQAGDVLVGVNGQTFDSEEKVMELAREIAGSYTAEFEFERNGRRMRASLPVNPRS